MEEKFQCCRPDPPCRNFCRLDGRLIAGEGVLRNANTGGEYEVLEVLARGDMGITYLVYNYQTGKLNVLKEINAYIATKAKAYELFQREARILKSLQHPGIPQFYDFFYTDQYYSLIMEMIHGKNLTQISPKDLRQALEWMLDLAGILRYLHARTPPVIHRDIKPANIILRYNPRRITLIDFGAVKEASTRPGTRIATPGYGAPEQQRGAPCIQSDFYSLGATLIYLLTQQSPTDFYILAQGKFVGLESVGIPVFVVKAINNLTASPEDRPRTAAEVEDLLRDCLQQLQDN